MFLFSLAWFCLCAIPIVPTVLGNEVQNEMLCADPECSVPISYASSLLNYHHINESQLSFKKGERMAILQKPITENKNLGYWYACIIEPSDKDSKIKIDINGKNARCGLVPKNLIKEFKRFYKPEMLIPVLAVKGGKSNEAPTDNQEKIELPVGSVAGGVAAEIGDRVPPSTPYEVIDGTTLQFLLDGEEKMKPTATQPLSFATSTPSVSSLDPANVQIVPPIVKPPMPQTEDNDGIDEEGEDEEEEDDDDEGGDDDMEDEENLTNEEIEVVKEPIVNSIDTASQNSIIKEEVTIMPTQVSTEFPPIETTHPPKADKPVVTETIKEKTEPEDIKQGLMSSFIDIDKVLNTEPGKSAENDEMILKQFSSTVPVTSQVVPNSFNTFNVKIPETQLPEETIISSSDKSIDPSATSDGNLLDNLENVTNITDKDENNIAESTEPTNVTHLLEKHSISDAVSDHVSSTNGSEIEQNIKVPVEDNQQIGENKDVEQVSESRINQQTAQMKLVDDQVLMPDKTALESKPQTPESKEPEPDMNQINTPVQSVPDKTTEPPTFQSQNMEPDFNQRNSLFEPAVTSLPTENLAEVIPRTVEEISLTTNIPTPVSEIFNEPPTVQRPSFTSGQMYPGLIPKTIPQTENQINHSIKPEPEAEDKPSLEEQTNIHNVTELSQELLEDNEKTYIPAETPLESIGDVNTKESFDVNEEIESIPEDPVAGVAYIEELTPQFPDRTSIDEDTQESKSGMLSGITGLFSGLFGSEPAQAENETLPLVEETTSPSLPEDLPKELEIVPNGECKTVSGLESECSDAPTSQNLFNIFEKSVPPSSYTTLYLIITSVTVLIFTLGYYFIERTRRDGPLVAKVNRLTHELQVATSQLQNRGIDTNNEQYIEASNELFELKNVKIKLEEQVESLQMELDGATEAGLELNKMVSDLLAQQEGSGSVLKSVEQLQGQLNGQQQVIDNMNFSLMEKSEENKVLQCELLAAQEKVDGLEEELVKLRKNIEQLLSDKDSAIWDLESRNTKLESDLVSLADIKRKELAELTEKNANEISELKSTLDEVNKRLKKRESEFHALDATIKQLQSQSQVDINAIYDIGLIQAELNRTRTEKETLQERLEDEEGARKLLEDHVRKVDQEVGELRSSFQAAEKDKIDAETRLTVLSLYFKEKEAHLQKELGLQEAMWVQKQGDDTTVYERMKSLQEEVESYNFDSLQYSNEGLSVTNSLSSMCTDPPSSISNLPSISISQEGNESQSSSSHACPEQRSLPITPVPKPRFLKRRKSSADFESRLGCVESMITPKSAIITRPIPDDLMKLQELKTVRASPFKDTSPSPDPFSESSTAFSNGIESCSSSFSKLVNEIQKIKSPIRSRRSPDSNFSFDSSVEYPLIESKSEELSPKCSLLVDKFEKLRPFANKLSLKKIESNNQPPNLRKIEETGIKFSALVDKFEQIKKSQFSTQPVQLPSTDNMDTQEDIIQINESSVKRSDLPLIEIGKEEVTNPNINKAYNLYNFSDKLLPFETSITEHGIPYNCNSISEIAVEPSGCNEIVMQTSPKKQRISQSDKSDSEDSQSVSKECDLSTARLEFDIKVVANASSKVKKIKKKSSRQKNGAQNEVLKKEIIDQERGFKGRIASLEKKAHESWVAARQAERRLDESKQEAGQLRNMITLIEKSNATETDGKITPRHGPGDLNGDSLPPLLPDGTSPLPLPPLTPSMLPPGFMPHFMPPPIDGFLPPPPFPPGDHRPPPLGRMSSPPLNHYSPNPVDYSYDRLSSPPPLSPPERDYRSPPADSDRYPRSPLSPWQELSPRSFRPVTSHRDSQKSYQGSNPSSVHSSSESLHKPTKRMDKYSKNLGHSKK